VFDSHCHLTDLDDPGAALVEAREDGVTAVLTCGVDAASNRAVCELRLRYPGLACALGLHPWHASDDLDEVLGQIEIERPLAVGEAGLDFWSDPPIHPRERQFEVLEAQLDLAGRLGLPVTLHSRKAVNELLPVLRNHSRVRGALHAYSGSFEQVQPFVDLGYLVGVGGGVTRPRARRIRRTVQQLPLEQLLLETDAPAIGMDIVEHIVEPPAVRPRHVRRVAEVVAELRGIAPSAVEAQTDANACALFGPAALTAPAIEPVGDVGA
jgi:TatD DNase family protein